MHSILTGKIDSGKTTRLLEKIKGDADTKYSGWLSLPYFEDNSKAGYDIVFIRESVFGGKKRLMRLNGFHGATRFRRFWIDEAVFREAAEYDFGSPAIFVIDEVGPLELEEKRGFWPLLETIYSSYDTVTVVRENCLGDFLGQFHNHTFEVVSKNSPSKLHL